jgi:hypothetical protein
MEKELDRIEIRLKEISDGASHDAWGPMYSAQAQSEIALLTVLQKNPSLFGTIVILD